MALKFRILTLLSDWHATLLLQGLDISSLHLEWRQYWGQDPSGINISWSWLFVMWLKACVLFWEVVEQYSFDAEAEDPIECLKNYGWRLVTLYRDSDQNHPRGEKNARRQSGCLRRFTNSWKKREVKGKWERAIYTQLNAEFQRIARRNKKASLSEQCKK